MALNLSIPKHLLFLLTAVGVFTGCANDHPNNLSNQASVHADSLPGSNAELLVSAAASLTESLNELKPLYQAEHPGIKLIYNFGASGTLQQQIEQGAPADLFVSAGQSQMNNLLDKHLILKDETAAILQNDLVLIVPENTESFTRIEDLTDSSITNIAIGAPESVPAGQYAQQTLLYYNLWDQLQSKLVQAKDVKQVLSYVQTGNADAGFVYQTDVTAKSGVKIALTADAASHAPIEYPAGVLAESNHKAEAEAFYHFLQSPESAEVFSKYGFTPMNTK